jgi:hypothetical protein
MRLMIVEDERRIVELVRTGLAKDPFRSRSLSERFTMSSKNASIASRGGNASQRRILSVTLAST